MSITDDDVPIGDRVAVARKIAGVNQRQLAQKSHYSVSMVRAVEQGREPASPEFVAAVAKALSIEPQELYGQPYHQLLAQDGGGLPGAAELQAILAEGNYVEPLDPTSADELSADLAAVQSHRHQDQARRALAKVPVLLRQLHGLTEASPPGAEREHAHRLLARAYANAAQLSYRFGWLVIASALLDRMETAAVPSGQPLLAAHAAQQRALLLMSHSAYESGQRYVQRSLNLIGPPEEEARLALAGAAHLRGAVLAARSRNRDRAAEHLREAERLAALIGHESPAYDTNMGPGNVAIHRIAVELDVGDPGRAARDGSRLRLPADVTATRVGRHWQDVARAWVLSGDSSAALNALYRARQAAPQQTRYHPHVRETIHAITAKQRRTSGNAAHFAHWLGLKT
ncbi:helix-turn-helix domain-containing protein [Nocardiopsis sp. HUAS JQ3]|uniref:helix-turn-helix domain-containing protein n=1 Tax=Nocardiopsis sp. HUAS JQ3 TaxID=3061629 RepID=UPI0023A9E416|nr:helix-turn-helix transcriptional regulator [Nocardiopsis sp. HUAS JQ3]WDZ90597.1 helix-turn-helix transcriptional regulator [Nocardiopsis sp. HUAS JQ3]